MHFAIDSSGIVRVSAEDNRSGVSDEIEISSPIGMSQSEIEVMQDGLNETPSVGDDQDGILDDINIQISSLEAKLITKGDELDPAIAESVKRSIDQAKEALSSDNETELQESLKNLEDHAQLFPQ